jgi:UDPglucose 6-dehydrogenase
MKVGIIGYGFVGQAIGLCYESKDLIVRDPKFSDSAELSKFNNCDCIFVCVPSPSREDGSCDTSILEQTIKELLFTVLNKDISVICKTTAPPSVYERLHKQYPNIVHCPEFLTAANAHEDYINSPYCVIGGDEKYCEMARKFIEPHLNISNFEYVITDIKTAALYKYIMNSYLAAKVTFMNEFYKLAKVEGVDWNRVKEIAQFDARIGATHMDVPGPDGSYGWGGACFPKDMAAIINEAKSLGVDFKLLEQIQDINKEHRNNG